MTNNKQQVCEATTGFLAALTCANYALHQAITEANGKLSEDTVGQVFDALRKCGLARAAALQDVKRAIDEAG